MSDILALPDCEADEGDEGDFSLKISKAQILRVRLNRKVIDFLNFKEPE